MAKRIYTSTFSSSIAGTDVDIIRINGTTGRVARILALKVGQDNRPAGSEVEMRRMTLIRPTILGGGSTVVTPRPKQVGTPAASIVTSMGFTSLGNLAVVCERWTFNTHHGLHVRWDEDDAWVLSPNQDYLVRISGGVLAMDFTYAVEFEELTA